MSKNVTYYPKAVIEWGKSLGVKSKPYALRWRLDFYYFSFRVHKWICSDDVRAYHSHPVNMLIWVIYGSYYDHTPTSVRWYKTGDVRLIRRNYRHFVDIRSTKPTWTFLFTWGSPKRWSFYDKKTLKRRNRDKYFIEKGHHVCDT